MKSFISLSAILLSTLLHGCADQPSPDQIEKCRGYDEATLVTAIVDHLKIAGDEDERKLTVDAVRIVGRPIFQSTDGAWLVPVDIAGTKHYNAMIDCKRHVEFSIRK